VHVTDAAPATVLRRFCSGDGSPAAHIHRSHSHELWRAPTIWRILRLTGAMTLWLLYVLHALVRATWHNGAAIRRRTGKRIVRQVGEQAWIAVVHAIPPYWYYRFELFDDERRRRAGEYLQRGETKRGVYTILKRTNGRSLSPLTDKVAFAARCHAHELRAIPVALAFEPGGASLDLSSVGALPKQDVFIKPNHGKGGRGAERWRYRHTGEYETDDGRMFSASQLVEYVRRLPFEEGVIVQPRRVNHPDLVALANGALATVRIVTCRNEDGSFEVTNAVLRMAQGRNHVVDNFHAGGLAASVDLATGRLGRATDMGTTPTMGWRDEHPDSGAAITGRTLPFWRETLDLVTRAHAAFADRIIIGWDVGLLPDGPELVEGNGAPDLDIIQRTHRNPLGNARLGELLAFHLRRVEAECSVVPVDRAGSPEHAHAHASRFTPAGTAG
jgi:hypothetical protein